MTASAILQDMSLCMECQSCRVACQMHYGLPPEQKLATVTARDEGTYPSVRHHAVRLTCLHCEKAACVESCPTAATYKGASGLTHFNAAKCIGCGNCVQYCPFDVPVLHNDEALRCSGCEDLTKIGKPPVCIGTCISGALAFGSREEMMAKAQKRVDALKQRWSNAQVYSPGGVGGTRLIWVLRDRPEVYGLPVAPHVPLRFASWQETLSVANPLSLAGGLLTAGLGWVLLARSQGRGNA